jgi:hypothetical protein
MPASKVQLLAYMSDDREVQVVADQRDFAKWEIQPEAMKAEAVVTRLRFLAWSAAFRQQLYKGSFVEFNELDCVEVTTPDSEDDTEGVGLDPSGPEAPATD